MGQLSVKSPNISFRDMGSVKSTDKAADKNKDVADAFRNLLKEKPEESKGTVQDEKEKLTETEREQPAGAVKEENNVCAELLGAVFLMPQMEQSIQMEENAGVMTEEILTISGETENAQFLAGAEEESLFPDDNVTETEKNVQTGIYGTGESAATEQVPEAAGKQTESVFGASSEQETLKETLKPAGSEGKKETASVKPNEADDKAEEKSLPVEGITNHNVQNTGSVSGAKPVDTEHLHVSRPEEIVQKLPDMLVSKISAGRQEFEIQIEPENLGRIAIKILHEAGRTMVSIACSESRTLELIGQNAREIGNVMERNLGSETAVYVEKKDSDYQNEYGDDHSGRESEQERQKEENRKQKTGDSAQFLQRLRLGLIN